MGRNYLWHHKGDASNAILAAAGYNFRRLIRWLRLLLCLILVRLAGIVQDDHKSDALRDLRLRIIPA